VKPLIWVALVAILGLAAACHQPSATQSEDQPQPVPGQMPRMGY
jgi:ABC-type glycerol-3-phosphate transport system substrate-binding protein